MSGRAFTGRKMLVLTVSAFGVIIGVNLILAYQAVHTFPGLEVRNSYVASQRFDRERAAQQALGWTVSAALEGENLVVRIEDGQGLPVRVAEIGGIFGRATTVRDDQRPEFVFDGRAYVAPVRLAPGYWHLRLKATAEDGTAFRQLLRLRVAGQGERRP